MPNQINLKRPSCIMPGFDKTKLRQYMELAQQRRAPKQDELAAEYASDPDILEHASLYPGSLEDVILGISEQDPRILDQGRRLLRKALRAGSAKTASKKPRRVVHPDDVTRKSTNKLDDSLQSTVDAPMASSDGARPQVFRIRDEDYSTAEEYGG